MSIFDRINQIESQINSLDSAFTTSMAKKTAATQTTTAANASSFQSIMSSMTQEQRFDPSQCLNSTGAVSNTAGGDPSQFESIISEASKQYNVDASLIKAVIRQESAFNPQATSYCGAQGLMQLMPETANGLGVKDAYNARDNIMGGAKYLSQLLDQFDGNMTKAIAAYNAGPGAVSQHGGVPPYPETQDYVNKVLGYYQDYKNN